MQERIYTDSGFESYLGSSTGVQSGDVPLLLNQQISEKMGEQGPAQGVIANEALMQRWREGDIDERALVAPPRGSSVINMGLGDVGFRLPAGH